MPACESGSAMNRKGIGAPHHGWRLALAGILLGAAALAVPSEVEAQSGVYSSTERILLTNQNRPFELATRVNNTYNDPSAPQSNGDVAQAFTTGDGGQIRPRKLTLWFANGTHNTILDADFSVVIYRDTEQYPPGSGSFVSRGRPTSSYITFTNPSNLGGEGPKVFTYDGPADLGRPVTYHIVVKYNKARGVNNLNLGRVGTGSDSSSQTGWSVGTLQRGQQTANTWVSNANASLRFRLEGVRSNDGAAASGGPMITLTSDTSTSFTGAPSAGTSLTAVTMGITDLSGLPTNTADYSWKWQWATTQNAADGAWTDISGATSATYTPVAADQGRHLRAEVSYTDLDGFDETVASDGTLAVNSPPTGGPPTITYTTSMPRVGTALTASTTGISDADGPATLTFKYQWRRADDASGGGAANISGETNSTYTLTTDDAGKFIQVIVSYTDDNDTDESLDSGWTEVANSAPTGGPPTITYTASMPRVGTALTAATTGISDADGPATLTFMYQWRRADDASGGGAVNISGGTSSTYTLATADAGKFIRVVVSYTDGGGEGESLDSAWVEVVNSDPVGGPPTIMGMARTGVTLTAVPGAITDADGGVPVNDEDFTYLWRLADDASGGGAADIPSSNSLTYTVTTADVGKYIRVVVSYTDGGGTDESLEGPWTEVENSDPVGKPTISGTLESGQGAEADTTGISDPDGPATLTFTGYQWRRADDAAGTTNAADIAGATASTYDLTRADEDRFIQVVVSYTDGVDNDHSVESDWTATGRANYDPAGGPPTITGTARVGLPLTAVTTGITDTDGPSPLVFTYQWRRADDSAGTANAADIPNTDSISYTLTAADAGKYIQVVVSYNDDGGTDESLDSAWTEVLNSAPVGRPTISGIPEAGHTVTAVTTGITDVDGGVPATAAGFAYQWRRADDETGTTGLINLGTGASYAVTTAEEDKFIQVVVTYTDGGGAEESVPSVWTATTRPPTIEGTPQVGRVLTAATTGVSDPDGPAMPDFSYQWWRADDVAGAGAAEINGADSSTYTLATADTGKFIRVVVAFMDGEGNEEIRRSAWTGPAAPETIGLLTINSPTVDEGDSGTTPMVFTVTPSLAPTAEETVSYAITGTATAGDDFAAATSGTLTFPAGSSAVQTIEVMVNGDMNQEDDETVIVTLSAPSLGLALGAGAIGTGTITNDDEFTLSIDSPEVDEGDAGTAQLTFTVTLGAVSTNPVTVDYEVTGGTAAEGADYAALPSGTLTIPAGMTSGTFAVTVNGDTDAEPSETVAVSLSNPGGGDPANPPAIETAVGTGTIRNDDSPTFTVDMPGVDEGDSGTSAMIFTVTMSPVWDETVTVGYAIAGGAAEGEATAGEDFLAASGTLIFAAGESEKLVAVTVLGDRAAEPDETVVLILSDTSDNAQIGQADWPGVIRTDDYEIEVAASAASIPEPAAGASVELLFTVTLAESWSREVEFAYTLGGSATEGADYSAVAATAMADRGTTDDGRLVFPQGMTVRTVRLSVNGDIVDEEAETIAIEVHSLAGARLGGEQATVTPPAARPAAVLSVVQLRTTELAEDDPVVVFRVSVEGARTAATTFDWRVTRIAEDGPGTALARTSGGLAPRATVEVLADSADPNNPPGVNARGSIAADESIAEIVATLVSSVASGDVLGIEIFNLGCGSSVCAVSQEGVAAANRGDLSADTADAALAAVVPVELGGGMEVLAQTHALAGFGRSVASGIVGGVWRRAEAHRLGERGSTAQLGGRAIDVQAMGSGDAGRAAREIASLFGVDVAAPPQHAGSGLGGWDEAPYGSDAWSGRPELLGGASLAKRSRFALPADDGMGTRSLTFWGETGATGFDGEPDEGAQVDGGTTTALTGVDWNTGEYLAGVAVSRSWGDADYSVDGGGGLAGVDGEQKVTLTTVSPYLHLLTSGGTGVWGSVGIGSGTMEMEGAVGVTETDVRLKMTAVGLKGPLKRAGDIDVALRGDFFHAQTEAKQAQGFDEVKAGASRMRLAWEGASRRELEGSGSTSSRFEMGARIDSGDGGEGMGLDFAAETHWAAPIAGLEVAGRVSALLMHEESGYREWAAGVAVMYAPGFGGRGMQLSLEPRWNTPRTDLATELWDGSGIDVDSGGAEDAGASLQARLGYGVGAMDERVLATSYGEAAVGVGERHLRLGMELRGSDSAIERIQVDLYGERGESDSEDAGSRLMLEARLGL